jgi:hypothetical protein
LLIDAGKDHVDIRVPKCGAGLLFGLCSVHFFFSVWWVRMVFFVVEFEGVIWPKWD